MRANKAVRADSFLSAPMLYSNLLSPGHFRPSPSLPYGVEQPPLHSYSSWRLSHSMMTPRQHWPVHCQPTEDTAQPVAQGPAHKATQETFAEWLPEQRDEP